MRPLGWGQTSSAVPETPVSQARQESEPYGCFVIMGDSWLPRDSPPIVPTAAHNFDSYLLNFLWSLSFIALSANVCCKILINLVSKP